MPDQLLPHAADDAAFEAVDPKTDYGPALRVLAQRHGLSAPGARFSSGSRPVFAAGDAVVKLYPAGDADAFANERRVLDALAGRLPFEVPRVRASGTIETWSYLVMNRVSGRPLREGLEGSDEQRRALFEAIGTATAALHSLASTAS